MRHFEKLTVYEEAVKLLKILPDGSKGPEDMFIGGAKYMHELMKQEVIDLHRDVEALKAEIVELTFQVKWGKVNLENERDNFMRIIANQNTGILHLADSLQESSEEPK